MKPSTRRRTARTLAEAGEREPVEVGLVPLVRPLGNLVILFAWAEAALLELATELKGVREDDAHKLLKAKDHLKQMQSLHQRSGLSGYMLDELTEHLDNYQADRDERSHLMHDEWYVGRPTNRSDASEADHPLPMWWNRSATRRPRSASFTRGLIHSAVRPTFAVNQPTVGEKTC